MLVGVVFLVRGCAGCGGAKPDSPVDEAEPKPKLKSDLGDEAAPKRKRKSDLGGTPGQEKQALDFTGLRGVLIGKWEMKKEYTENHTLEFTSGNTVYLKQYGSEKVGKYEFAGGLLTITAGDAGLRRAEVGLRKPKAPADADPNVYTYGVEFLSDGELSLRLEQSGQGFDWFQLAGRWQRIGLPADKQELQKSSGPIADAKRQVQRIEQLLAKREGILKSALANRDELAEKLRSVGVNSPADLKGNIRGMRLAKNAVELATEIEGLEQQLAVIDTALLRAKSLVRQMESEQSSLSPDELRKLAEQLKEVESRTAGEPLPVTPLDVDAAVEKALKASPKQAPRTKSK